MKKLAFCAAVVAAFGLGVFFSSYGVTFVSMANAATAADPCILLSESDSYQDGLFLKKVNMAHRQGYRMVGYALVQAPLADNKLFHSGVMCKQ